VAGGVRVQFDRLIRCRELIAARGGRGGAVACGASAAAGEKSLALDFWASGPPPVGRAGWAALRAGLRE
jgi:hypothetical protein